ncbi:RNase adapter RapZ [Desulfobacterium sp. N47]|uniref:RNase adapter RapZ n=1 Tax=Desulfobacterium sp. N47 TaxID=3115210 RepID=UPI003C96A87C
MNNLKIFIITGLSGSGKSTAIAAFEDAGFYCVDNMPVALLTSFLKLPIKSSEEIAGLAFVMDLREKDFLTKYKSVFDSIKQNNYYFEIMFLEADEEVLLQRFSQTRRHHPLSRGKTLIENIRIEKEQLKDLKTVSDRVINTSRHSVHELKAIISDIAYKSKNTSPMNVHILSFGYKYGIPIDSDLIIDVRFLANPYFKPELRDLDGENQKVENFVLKNRQTKTFLKKYLELLDYLIPLYEKEGKAYLTISIGCTGGRHRSVAIAGNIYKHLEKSGIRISISHRDISR